MKSLGVLRILGICAGLAGFLLSLVIVSGEGIPSLRFLLFFLVPSCLALVAFASPSRFVNVTLALAWSAGILMAIGSAVAFIGSGFLYLPVAAAILIPTVVITMSRPQPWPDLLGLVVAAILAWSISMASINFATPAAISRPALAIALVLALVIGLRRQPVQSWVIAVLLITVLSPWLVETASGFADFGREGASHRFEQIARRIVFEHPKTGAGQLTRLFKDAAAPTLSKGEKFTGLIKSEGPGAYSVSWQVERRDSGVSGGFFIGQPPTGRGPIRMSVPARKP